MPDVPFSSSSFIMIHRCIDMPSMYHYKKNECLKLYCLIHITDNQPSTFFINKMSDDGNDNFEDDGGIAEDPEEIVEDEEENTFDIDEIIDEQSTFENYESHVFQKTLSAEKKTLPIMTKYEKTRIIGVRSQQIARGAPLYVARGLETNPIRLAEKELHAGKLPYIIRRKLPDDSFEDWKISELIILDNGNETNNK